METEIDYFFNQTVVVDDHDDVPMMNRVAAAVFSVVFVLGLAGNLMVIVAIVVDRRMHCSISTLIACLAVVNLLFIVLCLPSTALTYVTDTWMFGNAWCKVSAHKLASDGAFKCNKNERVTSTGFLFTTEYSSKSLHLSVKHWQSVSHFISTISSNYTNHHEFSVLQPSKDSEYHIFWSARLQLQLSCNMKFHSYLKQQETHQEMRYPNVTFSYLRQHDKRHTN